MFKLIEIALMALGVLRIYEFFRDRKKGSNNDQDNDQEHA